MGAKNTIIYQIFTEGVEVTEFATGAGLVEGAELSRKIRNNY